MVHLGACVPEEDAGNGCDLPARHASSLAILQGMASEGNIEKIKTYLNSAQSDIDAITPIRFCENETVNLVLSTFANKAKQAGVTMTVHAELPDSYH